MQGAFGVLGGRAELLEVPVAVPELVGELRLVEEPCPVRDLVGGPGRLQCALGPDQGGGAGPNLAQYAVPACLDGVQQRLYERRGVGPDALLGDPRELHGLPPVPEVDGLPAHRDQHIGAVRPVPGRLREPQRLYEVALG